MSSDPEIDAWLDASAVLLGIPIAGAWREGVRQHLRITREMAERVLDFPLPDDADPAPVFRA